MTVHSLVITSIIALFFFNFFIRNTSWFLNIMNKNISLIGAEFESKQKRQDRIYNASLESLEIKNQ